MPDQHDQNAAVLGRISPRKAPPGQASAAPSGPAATNPTPPPPAASASARWPVRSAMTLGLIALFALVFGFGGWAMATRIAGAVVAHGQVEVQSHRQVVQHPDGGVVNDILVREGDQVDAAQPLIRLDGTLLRTELAIVEGQYFEILARKGRLQAERNDDTTVTFSAALTEASASEPALQELIEGQTSLFAARRDTIQQSLDQLAKQSDQVSAQIDGINAQIVALDQQRVLIEKELADQQSLLDKGLAQASRVLALQREQANLDGNLGELRSSAAQAESRRTGIDIERLRLNAERREGAETELRDLGYRELELAERRRALTEQIDRLEIRAPVSGIVYDLQVTTPRSVIRPADPVMYIVPQDRPLVVAARINTINIDEVHAGQQVRLRFAAFSSRTTPEIYGTLSRVSADALIDETTRAPYYRGEVTIPADELAKLRDLALIPGMPVEVYIQTGERSPMNYLIKPMADYLNRAFREG